MEKVNVAKEKCIGCGACVSIASNNFNFDDEGKSEVINETVTDETIEAKESCPTDAIEIKEDN